MNAARVHVVLSLALAALSACVSDRPDPVAPGPGDGEPVRIAGFAFVPPELTVQVGTSVVWTNDDNVIHTVTADDGSFDSATFTRGQTFSLTPAVAGEFPYFCEVHPFMRGTLTVVE
jgi:plastocyanin